MVTGILTLAGVALGYWLTERRAARRDAALIEALHPRIVNTIAPTTAELTEAFDRVHRKASATTDGWFA